MPNIAKNIATTAAIRRIGYVLREKLQGELDTFSEPAGLQAPETDAYHLLGERLTDELIAQHGVLCLIEQVRPAATLDDLTRMGSEQGAEVRLPLKVRIVFEAPASFRPATVNGKQQTRAEWVQLASERYCGALINTVHAYAVENYAIQDVTLESDFSSLGTLQDEVLIGGCVCEFNILQSVYVPAHTYTI